MKSALDPHSANMSPRGSTCWALGLSKGPREKGGGPCDAGPPALWGLNRCRETRSPLPTHCLLLRAKLARQACMNVPEAVCGLACLHPSALPQPVYCPAGTHPILCWGLGGLSGEPCLPRQPSSLFGHRQTQLFFLLTALASPWWPHRPQAETEGCLCG